MNTKLGNWLRGVSALALVSVFANSASAATPVAVWDGDFSETTKGDYTLDVNNNEWVTDGDGNKIGIKITQTTGIKISGLNSKQAAVVIGYKNRPEVEAGTNQFMVSFGTSDAAGYADLVGCGFCNESGTKYGVGVHQTGWWEAAGNRAARNPYEVTETAGTEYFLAYSQDHNGNTGARMFTSTDGYNYTLLWGNSGLRSSNAALTRIAIGAPQITNGSRASSNPLKVPTNVVVTRIAVFNTLLGASGATSVNYRFPSDYPKYVGTATGTLDGFSAVTWQGTALPDTGDSLGYVTLTLTGDTTITVDEASECASFKLVGSHDFTIAGSGSFKCPILDLSDFTGNLTLKSTTTSSAITVPSECCCSEILFAV